jgi:hypothetical protein
MDIKKICNGMSAELAGWKTKLYDVISHGETLSGLDRQYFAPDINSLRALISVIEDRALAFKVKCPVDFSVASKAA